MNTHARTRARAAMAIVAALALGSCSSGSNDTAGPPGTAGHGGAGGLDAAAETGVCVPGTCAKLGVDCGSAPDGCGGIVVCEPCTEGKFCGGAGPNKCGTKPCTALTCETAKAECGFISDGCGTAPFCGTCQGNKSCGATNHCEVGQGGSGGSGKGGSSGSGGSAGNGGNAGGDGGSGGSGDGGSSGGCQQGSPCDPGVVCHDGFWDCNLDSCQKGAQMPAGATCHFGPTMYCTASGGCIYCAEGAVCNPTACTQGFISCSIGDPVCNSNVTNVSQGTACPGGTCDGAGQCIPDCVPDGTCSGLPNCACTPGVALNEYCYDGGGGFNETKLAASCGVSAQATGVNSCGKPCTGSCKDTCTWTCHDGGNADCSVDRGYGPPANGTCTCD